MSSRNEMNPMRWTLLGLHLMSMAYQRTLIERDNAMTDLMHDPLTDLFSRRYLLGKDESDNHSGELGRSIDIASRQNTPLSIVMLDPNRFKSFNDTYGHSCGDFVLTELAKRLISQARATDIIARYGGDEFVILLPGNKNSKRVANRIARVCQEALMYSGHELELSLSMGIVDYQIGMDKSDMLRQADKLMYTAKNAASNGESRVCYVDKGNVRLKIFKKK